MSGGGRAGRRWPPSRRVLAWSGAVLLVLVTAVGALAVRGASQVAAPVVPTTPERVCGADVLRSPYDHTGPAGTFTPRTAPDGLPTFGAPGSDFPTMRKLVVIPAGDNTTAAVEAEYEGDHTVYYFAPGLHRITAGMYAGHDSVYIGGYTPAAGPAVVDGVDGATRGTGKGGAFFALSKPSSGNTTRNTWMYLTVRNYTSSVNNAVMGNVNGGDAGVGDTYRFNTIGPNPYGYQGDDRPPAHGQSGGGGYGIMMGGDTTVEHNCIVDNAQGGFNGSGPNITISHNEIARNGLGVYPDIQGDGGSPHSCGCSGGGKLNFTTNATVTHNYVHDNYNAGIWFDFDNIGADISFNYVASNWATAIEYEASYNADITYNTLVDNGWASHGAWPEGVGGRPCYGGVSCTNGLGPVTGLGGGNPFSAIYIANSGGNPELGTLTLPGGKTVPGRFNGRILVKGNVLIDNFGGVDVYTDTDRYPGGVNNDSACGVPLNGMVAQYYRQTKVLRADAADIRGTSVRSRSGAHTLCSFYDSGSQGNGYEEILPRTPLPGMAVYTLDDGTFLGHVVSADGPDTFTLDRATGDAEGVDLPLSAYGGCGPANYFGGGQGRTSGRPAAQYWDNCIWGSRNVVVTANTFSLDADRVTGCTTINLCGYMMARAHNPGVPTLVRYFASYTDLTARATGGLGNVWTDNTYTWSGDGPGQWQFQAGQQGNDVSRDEWQGDPFDQDAYSVFRTGGPPGPDEGGRGDR